MIWILLCHNIDKNSILFLKISDHLIFCRDKNIEIFSIKFRFIQLLNKKMRSLSSDVWYIILNFVNDNRHIYQNVTLLRKDILKIAK